MYKMINGKKRIFYLDFIRALAIIFVLLAHITRAFFQNASNLYFRYLCASLIDFGVLGVPLFLMISGALLLNKDYKLSTFLKRRYIRVIIPFLFWNIIIIFSKIIFEGKTVTLSNIKHMYFYNFWFVWMILGVYLFIPVINSFIKEYKIRGMEYFLAIWFVVIFLNTIGLYPFFQFELSYFAGYLGYFVLGYYLSNKNFKLSHSHLIIISLKIFSLFTFINIYYTLSECRKKNKLLYYKYKTIIVVLQSTGLYSFIRYFTLIGPIKTTFFNNKIYLFLKDLILSKIIFSISKFSYGIYLIHYNILFFFKWLSHNYIPIFTWNPIIWLPIMLIIITGSSWFILWIFGHIPILRLINGAN